MGCDFWLGSITIALEDEELFSLQRSDETRSCRREESVTKTSISGFGGGTSALRENAVSRPNAARAALAAVVFKNSRRFGMAHFTAPAFVYKAMFGINRPAGYADREHCFRLARS